MELSRIPYSLVMSIISKGTRLFSQALEKYNGNLHRHFSQAIIRKECGNEVSSKDLVKEGYRIFSNIRRIVQKILH